MDMDNDIMNYYVNVQQQLQLSRYLVQQLNLSIYLHKLYYNIFVIQIYIFHTLLLTYLYVLELYRQKQILKVVQHLHSLDILHRDIKLQNVFLRIPNDIGSLVLADFGLACHKSQIPYYNTRCGTPGYTAPEVFTQSMYDSKADIFSCGVMFFNLLTLKNPFGSSKNPQTLLLKNIAVDYDLTHLDLIKTSNPLACDLVIQMLQKDSKLRPSAKQCLEHPFFNQVIAEQKEDSTFDNTQFNNPIHQIVKVNQTKPHQMPQFK